MGCRRQEYTDTQPSQDPPCQQSSFDGVVLSALMCFNRPAGPGLVSGHMATLGKNLGYSLQLWCL